MGVGLLFESWSCCWVVWILTRCYCLIELFSIPRSQFLCPPVNPSSALNFETERVVVFEWFGCLFGDSIGTLLLPYGCLICVLSGQSAL